MMRNANQRQIFVPKCLLITFQFCILVFPSLLNNYLTNTQKLMMNFSRQEATNIPIKSHAAPFQCLPQRNTSQPHGLIQQLLN